MEISFYVSEILDLYKLLAKAHHYLSHPHDSKAQHLCHYTGPK